MLSRIVVSTSVADVEHLDVVDGHSEIGDLLVHEYRIEWIFRFGDRRCCNRRHLSGSFGFGRCLLPQISRITFSNDDVYNNVEIRQFGIIVPCCFARIENSRRKYRERKILFLFTGVQRLEESVLPKKLWLGVTKPEVEQYGVVQIVRRRCGYTPAVPLPASALGRDRRFS